jgi:hypothetical protein
MTIEQVAQEHVERLHRESAEHRARLLAMNAEIAESALEAAFVAWARSPACRRSEMGPCARADCLVGHISEGRARETMCAAYREHLARAVAEVM